METKDKKTNKFVIVKELINERENKDINQYRKCLSMDEFILIWGNQRSAKIMTTKLLKRGLIKKTEKKYWVTDKGARFQQLAGFL